MKIQCLGCFNDFESEAPQAIVKGVDVCPGCREALEVGRLMKNFRPGLSLIRWTEGWDVVSTRARVMEIGGATLMDALRKAVGK